MTERSGYVLETLREGREFTLYRGRQHGSPFPILAVALAAERPSSQSLARLEHEYSLAAELDPACAARPLALTRQEGRTMLVLEDPGGEPLDRLLGKPMELRQFLRFAIGLSAAVGRVHERGLVHKDIKPAHVLVNVASAEVWLTGFGFASRLPRERQGPEPPEAISGTLAYMAPEQTGRMNRSIDSRSDLYSLGVTLYEMLTGSLPFAASDPMEWVHSHIAKEPVPPNERSTEIPSPVGGIVLKLLAKTGEERYQTAGGVEADLRHCLAEWESLGRIDPFPLGTRDTSDRLVVPERLYGRERETQALIEAFDQVVRTGAPALVLVSGYSGIGKSSVVNELHQALVPPRGLFASGKFDQYKRDIPYATLAQAFQALVRSILGQSDAELARWRDALREALGPNGQLIVNLVPELELVLGPQLPVAELAPQDAKNRFQTLFRRFVAVFARQEHPLALFLDDLQWLDAATLDLLGPLVTHPEVRHLLLVGAYRDNEVDAAHPLMRTLEAIRSAGARVQEIVLAPLGPDDVDRLISDALHCEPERALPLAQLVHEKTGGNPFFAIQFFTALDDEALLTFDPVAPGWQWDMHRIHARSYTDNVVELMAGKLKRLSTPTQEALKRLAFLGNIAEVATLTVVHGDTADAMHGELQEAVHAGLVIRLESEYRFLHDRIQQAAYSLVAEEDRESVHLRIGRVLLASMTADRLAEHVFEIVNQLNRGAALITAGEERERLAELNLLAARRAKASTAYASALTYLAAGAALLAEDSWERCHELAFALQLNRAECEFLSGALAEAEERLTWLSTRAANTVEQAAVACLRLDVYLTLDQSGRAVTVGLDYLRDVGVDLPAHPSEEDARREYDRTWSRLRHQSLEEFVSLPLMSDPASLATLDVLTKLSAPANFISADLVCVILCRAANLSLERGHSDGSCVALALIGMLAAPRFGDYQAVIRLAQLGYELVERRGLKRFQAETYIYVATVMQWTQHPRAGRDLLREAFTVASRSGNLTFASLSCNNLVSNLLAAGVALHDVQREAEHGLAFARNARFGMVIDIITSQLGLIRTLRGLTPKFGCFDEGEFNELHFEGHLADRPALAIAECWYWIRKLQARFFADDHAAAIHAASMAQRLLWTSPLLPERADYHYYAGLSRAALYDTAPAGERPQDLRSLAAHHEQLQAWAANCPENFGNGAALLGAEIARIEGRDLDAMHLYEEAIRSARANDFVHNEAVANELAGRFYLARGLEKNGHAHLHDARACYALWGADGKTKQLDRLYPHLADRERHPSAANSGSAGQQLDVASVVNASHAISGQIVLEDLVDTLMRIVLENAGAQTCHLLLARDERLVLTAEAGIEHQKIQVRVHRDPAPPESALPASIVNYVRRSRERVLLADAAQSNRFSTDGYFAGRQPKSVLCLPIMRRSTLIGLLYLENNLATHAFTSDRVAVLEVLASQAAISLENALLYTQLREREARIRRLFEANVVGVHFWDIDGGLTDANDAFLRIVGYSRQDLLSGNVNWASMTAPEYRAADAHALEELAQSGTFQPYEKEYIRKNGERVAVLVAGATFEGSSEQGVAFILDLTERKRLGQRLRQAEKMEAVGRLAGGIAHDFNNVLAGILAYGEMLFEEAPADSARKRYAQNVLTAATRGRALVDQILTYSRSQRGKRVPTDICRTVTETLELVKGSLPANICVDATAPTLPLIVTGDATQLHQVAMNLCSNAIQAMSAGGTLRVALEAADLLEQRALTHGMLKPGGYVRLTVEDSGSGMDEPTLVRIFEPFFTTKDVGRGTGLGLSLVYAIVTDLGGAIDVKSALNDGSTFSIYLPLAEVATAAQAEVPTGGNAERVVLHQIPEA